MAENADVLLRSLARSQAVLLFWFIRSGSTPRSFIRCFTVLSLLWTTARWRHVFPAEFCRLTSSALSLINSLNTAIWPTEAALWMGQLPESFCWCLKEGSYVRNIGRMHAASLNFSSAQRWCKTLFPLVSHTNLPFLNSFTKLCFVSAILESSKLSNRMRTGFTSFTVCWLWFAIIGLCLDWFTSKLSISIYSPIAAQCAGVFPSTSCALTSQNCCCSNASRYRALRW